ncbi:MAG: FkbM family methyltransferase [Chthoniobacterales bacterium]
MALSYFPASLLKVARSLHYRSSLTHYDMTMEPDLLGCQKLIVPGETVLDVGANIGVYTRFCSDFVGPSGQVISLEPLPETFSYLVQNVHSLGLKNVRCLNLAASDHDGDSDAMTVPKYPTGGTNLYEAALSSTGNIRVKTAKLDTLFSDLSPHFIKCDVEGHEVECIRGAMELIRRCRPKWMIEVSKKETFELFYPLGYKAFFYEEGQFHSYDGACARTNYFFLPD